MNLPTNLDVLSPNELRTLAAQLMTQAGEKDRGLRCRQVKINQLTHELATHKRWRFDKHSEQLISGRVGLLSKAIDADLEAIKTKLEAPLPSSESEAKNKPERQALPLQLPHTDIHHEPDTETYAYRCVLKRIDEDISEKLDYTPGTFTMRRHIRGKWVCDQCETLVQMPVPPHVIDRGIPTAGLLTHTLVFKFGDHLPLYRQERIYARVGLAIPQSTLGAQVSIYGMRLQPLVDALREEVLSHDVLRAGETPAQILVPGNGKTRHAYLQAYVPSEFEETRVMIHQFALSRNGEHARVFLGQWQGKLVHGDFVDYKASFSGDVTEIGCMAHSRRKFLELHDKHKSELTSQTLRYMVSLYEIETQVRDTEPDQRLTARQQRAGPILERLHTWLEGQRRRVLDGSAIVRAVDYSLKRWPALVRYLDDPAVPIDNDHVEQQIRPVALGRFSQLFADSLCAGQHAAAVVSLIQLTKLNGHDPYIYLKDVLTQLPTHKVIDIAELLSHRWTPNAAQLARRVHRVLTRLVP